MTFECYSLRYVLSAIPLTVTPSVALLADNTGRSYPTDETVNNWRTIGRAILTLPSVIILSAVCIAQN